MKVMALGSIIVTTLLLAINFIGANDWIPALSAITLGALWSAGLWRNWDWANAIGLVAFVGLAGFGVWRNLTTIWMLLGTVAALVSWDLAHFSQRLTTIESLDERHFPQRTHFERLLIVSALGLLLGSIGWGFQISLNFGWVIFLGFLIAISLSWVVGVIRRMES